MEKSVPAINKAFEWIILLMTVILAVIIQFINWFTTPTPPVVLPVLVSLASRFILSLVLPLIFAIGLWLWQLLSQSNEKRIVLAFSSWGVIIVIFSY